MTRAVVPLRTMPGEAPDVHASFKIFENRVLIFHRADSPNWFALWRTEDGQQIQQSLRTTDRALATERTTRLFIEYETKVKHGLSVKTTTFGYVCDVLLAEVEEELIQRGKQHTTKLKDYRTRIGRYFKPYFGDQPVDAIKTSDIAKYRDWRRAYWTTGPGSRQTELTYLRGGKTVTVQGGPSRKGNGDATLPEDVTLRAIFNCAAKHGWINQERIPKIETKKGRANSREAFTPEEEEALLATADAWVNAARNDKIRAVRQLTTDYVTILFATGMRPGEALKLRWCDIEPFRDVDGVRNVRIWVAEDNKTGKRDPVARAYAEVTITAMALDRPPELKQPDQPVFVTPDGRRPVDFAAPFERWLDFAGLLRNPRGGKRTIYSCRHTYITSALAKRFTTHEVSRQVGTGTPVIDKHYSKLNSSMNASRLSGRKPVD